LLSWLDPKNKVIKEWLILIKINFAGKLFFCRRVETTACRVHYRSGFPPPEIIQGRKFEMHGISTVKLLVMPLQHLSCGFLKECQ